MLAGIFIATVFVVGLVIAMVTHGQHLAKLKLEYDQARESGDKAKALEAGRKYYAALRRERRLSVYDEQAIANDLSVM